MDGRKQFTFFSSYLDAIDELPRRIQGEIVLAIAEYALRGTVPVLTGTAKTVFTLVRPTLDKGAARAKAIEARWKKEHTDDTNAIQNEYKTDTKPIQPEKKPDAIPSEGVREGVGIGVRYNPPTPLTKGGARFIPPTVEEVAAYCQERRNSVDPSAFVDFYASKGWKVGSNPMKDWRAAVRTWEQREGRGPGTANRPRTSNPFLAMAMEMEDDA